MARPGGKAARRRARQRPPRRPVIAQPGLTRQPSRTEPAADARTDAAPAATSSPALPAPVTSAVRASSRLGERARAEYHYVGRDLRNIAVLTAVMAALLAVATVALPAIGLVGP